MKLTCQQNISCGIRTLQTKFEYIEYIVLCHVDTEMLPAAMQEKLRKSLNIFGFSGNKQRRDCNFETEFMASEFRFYLAVCKTFLTLLVMYEKPTQICILSRSFCMPF